MPPDTPACYDLHDFIAHVDDMEASLSNALVGLTLAEVMNEAVPGLQSHCWKTGNPSQSLSRGDSSMFDSLKHSITSVPGMISPPIQGID